MGFLGGINDSGIESQPHEYETVFEEILRNLKRGLHLIVDLTHGNTSGNRGLMRENVVTDWTCLGEERTS